MPHIVVDEVVYQVGLYHYNWHKEIEIFWLLNGEVEMNVDGQTKLLQVDDLYVINSNVGHATFATSPDTIALRLHINPMFFIQQGVDVSTGKFNINSMIDDKNESLHALKRSLASLHLQILENPENIFRINAYYYQIAALLLDNFVPYEDEVGSNMLHQENNIVIKKVIQYIEKNYNRDISLDYLAEKSNYTPAYLSKKIKDEIGINYHDFLTRCRLRYAVSKLTQTGLIGDIALNSGFKDVRAFNLMFKRHFGMTPSQYRDKLGDSHQVGADRFNQKLNLKQVTIYQTYLQDVLNRK